MLNGTRSNLSKTRTYLQCIKESLSSRGIKMKRITVILVSFLLMTGCATDGKFSASRKFDISPATLAALADECDVVGGTPTKLDYGFNGSTENSKKRIKIKGLVHVVPGEFFAIKLKPKGNDKIRPDLIVEDLVVTISGKPAVGLPSGWLKAGPKSYNDTEPDDYQLFICVPSGLAHGAYYYNVEIEAIGNLDPRADVC